MLILATSLLLAACDGISKAHEYVVYILHNEQYNIIVNGMRLDDVTSESYPTHVPLIVVARAFGAEVLWDSDTGEVVLYGLNGKIIATEGSESFLLDQETIIIPGLSAVVIDGRLHVPFQFFSDVLGVNNAYFKDGQIFIYN